MKVIRQYLMAAADGHSDTLIDALQRLADRVRGIEGCERVAIYEVMDRPGDFIFAEYWASMEAHRAGSKNIDRQAFALVLAAVSATPTGSYLREIP